MKNFFTTILLIMVAMTTWAYDVEVDGIYYNLVAKAKTAEVTFKGATYSEVKSYSGTVTIPETIVSDGITYPVTIIGENAFNGCTGLTSVTIPNTVTSIGESSFCGCTGLTSVTIPNSITNIGSWAFSGCTGLTSVTIPNSLTTIMARTFDECTSLTSVTIPNSVTTIGVRAFSGCAALPSVTIPSSVTSIEYGAFLNCTALKSVNISDLSSWCKISCDGYYGNPLRCAHHLFLNGEEIIHLVIPNDVSIIEMSAFSYCTSLSSVTIGNSVTSIGGSAFYNCTGLTSVTIGNSVKSIESYAFDGCTGLTSVDIPNSVRSIKGSAFSGCTGIKSISIGSGVTKISTEAFASCKNIETVTCYAESVPSMGTDVFKDSYVSASTLKVPDASVDLYKAASQWKEFATIQGINGSEPTPTPKCAKPTIAFANNELTYTSETEGAGFISEVTCADVKKSYDAKVTLTATYNISVYATKTGYDNSETATATLVWATGSLNPETSAKEISVDAIPLLITQNGGVVTVSGVADGETVSAYSVGGTSVAAAKAVNKAVTLDLSSISGQIVVLKVGSKSAKVIVK